MSRAKTATGQLAELPFALTAEERMRVYSPEEVISLKLLNCSVRWLKEAAYGRKVPFTKQPSGMGFRLDQIWWISQSFDQQPLAA